MTEAKTRPVLDFLVVGAQRSATTYLNACLRDHPQIYMCRDEVPYFEAPFFATSSLAELRSAVADATSGQRRGIQRPDYLGRPECPANIRSVLPQARILAVLRDPVSRAVSAYHWYVQFGLLPLLPLDVGMERLLDGWLDPAYPRAREVLGLGYYGRHVSRYLDTFGSDQVLVLLGADLRQPATLPRVYRFLGVDENHESRVVHRRTNAGTYDLRRLRVLRARRRFAWSWDDVTEYRYQPRRLRRPLASALSASIVALDRCLLARLLTGVRPVLRPDLERRLRALYDDDVVTLEGLLGRDLGAWRSLESRFDSTTPEL